MTFSINVPNGAQSPGLFPVQNNTNMTRLKTIINAEHVFNDTAAANDGVHRQMTLVNRADPVVLPAGTNSMLYGKAAADAVNELWFYNGVTPRQMGWRELSGTVAVSGAFATIAAIPTNCYGFIYMFKDLMTQAGMFVSNGVTVNGTTYVEKFGVGQNTDYVLRLGNGTEAAGLNLRVQTNVNTVNGVTTTGNWTYKIFLRKI